MVFMITENKHLIAMLSDFILQVILKLPYCQVLWSIQKNTHTHLKRLLRCFSLSPPPSCERLGMLHGLQKTGGDRVQRWTRESSSLP